MLVALRAVLPTDHAILRIDFGPIAAGSGRARSRLAGTAAVATTVLAAAVGRVAGPGSARGERGGLSGITVACEPTGHRWMIVQQLYRRTYSQSSAKPTSPNHRPLVGRMHPPLRLHKPSDTTGQTRD
jgi:hypothetical protein